MEDGTVRYKIAELLAVIQNDECERKDGPSCSTSIKRDKMSVVCAGLSRTARLVGKSGLIVFGTVEDGFVKFSWKMEQMCVAMCEVCVLL